MTPEQDRAAQARMVALIERDRARYGNAAEAWQVWPTPNAFAVEADGAEHPLVELVRFVLAFAWRHGRDVVRAQRARRG